MWGTGSSAQALRRVQDYLWGAHKSDLVLFKLGSSDLDYHILQTAPTRLWKLQKRTWSKHLSIVNVILELQSSRASEATPPVILRDLAQPPLFSPFI